METSVDTPIAKNWFYNISPTYKVNNISLVDSSDNTYRVNLNVDHALNWEILEQSFQMMEYSKPTTIIDIPSSKSIIIKGQGNLSLEYMTYSREIF